MVNEFHREPTEAFEAAIEAGVLSRTAGTANDVARFMYMGSDITDGDRFRDLFKHIETRAYVQHVYPKKGVILRGGAHAGEVAADPIKAELVAMLGLAAETIQGTLDDRGYRHGEDVSQWVPQVGVELAALVKIRAALAKVEG